MAEETVPNDYTDPFWTDLSEKAERKLGLPAGMVQAVVTHGERSNNDQVSEAGAKTPFQITPSTRKLILDKHGIDAYLNPKNAADSAALLLKESLDRNNGDIEQAIREYHGGTDRKNWGKKTQEYINRVKNGIQEKQLDNVIKGFGDFLKEEKTNQVIKSDESKNINPHEELIKGFGEYLASQPKPPDQPEVSLNSPGLIDRAADLVTGDLRKVPTTEALPSINDMPEFTGLKAMTDPAYWKTAIGTTFTNPDETAKIIKANFPNVKVEQDSKGNYLLTSGINGQQFAIHPGFEASDIPKFIGEGVVLHPGGRVLHAAGEGLLHAAGGKVLNAGLRQAGVEASQAATGGEFNPEQVAATALLGAAPEALQAAKPAVVGAVDAVKQPLKNLTDSVLGKAPANVGTQGAESAGADTVSRELYRQNLGEKLGFKEQSTKGQITRNPEDQQFERETAKDMEKGKLLRDKYAAQLHEVHGKLNEFQDLTGAEKENHIEAGSIIKKAIQDKSELKRNEISKAYEKAKNSPEGDNNVQLNGLVHLVNDEVKKSATVALPHDVEKLLLHHGFAYKNADGDLVPVKGIVRNAENLYTDINNKISQHADKNSYRLGKQFKYLINDATNDVSGPLYSNAKKLRTEYGKQFENHNIIDKLLKTETGKTDQKVENSEVIHHLIFGSDSTPEALTHAKRVIQSSPNGDQAWKELRGQVIKHIKDQAFSNNATNRADEVMFSSPKYDAILKKIGPDKLKTIFGKNDAELLEDISEYTKHIFTTTPEAALNSSNNAGKIITGIFDIVLSSSLGGMPVPVATLGRLGLKHIKDTKIKNRILVHLNHRAK